MKRPAKQRKIIANYLEILIIPAIIIAGIIFHLSQAFLVPLITIVILFLGAVLLWARANKDADGSEWWQDDDASGWRGY
ncbi:MAG: hypothetical protein ACK2U0_18705 [Candidatus Promineifilaceae bacterium]